MNEKKWTDLVIAKRTEVEKHHKAFFNRYKEIFVDALSDGELSERYGITHAGTLELFKALIRRYYWDHCARVPYVGDIVALIIEHITRNGATKYDIEMVKAILTKYLF